MATANIAQVRRALLPRWIRFFSWIFTIFLLLPVGLPLLAFLAPESSQFMVFGLSYVGSPLTVPALLIAGLLFAIGVAGYGLLRGRDWGIDAGLAAGLVGLVLCAFTAIVSNFSSVPWSHCCRCRLSSNSRA